MRADSRSQGTAEAGVGEREKIQGWKRNETQHGGAEWGKTEATKTMATAMSVRKRTTEDLSVSMQENITGGKYHLGRRGTEESVDESAEWSGEETGESATKEEADTTWGLG